VVVAADAFAAVAASDAFLEHGHRLEQAVQHERSSFVGVLSSLVIKRSKEARSSQNRLESRLLAS
jgi:hypothetical protein